MSSGQLVTPMGVLPSCAWVAKASKPLRREGLADHLADGFPELRSVTSLHLDSHSAAKLKGSHCTLNERLTQRSGRVRFPS